MEQIDLTELADQFAGRKFGELVLEHRKRQSVDQLTAALRGTLEALPPEVRPEIEGMIDRANSLGHKKEFWAEDCGRSLLFICSMAEKELEEPGVRASQDLLFDVFNIVVMNFAYSAHRDSRFAAFIESAVGKRGLLRRLFG